MARTIIGIILVLAIFAGLGTLGWYLVNERIRSQPAYILSAGNVRVSPPPDWVPEQFVEDTLNSSGLNKTGSLLDKTLPQKLAETFAAYPWVEKVEQVVLRYPSGADVKLSYRTPTALVELPQRGVVPVDHNGVLLPMEYLSDSTADRLREHLIIQGIQSTPPGFAGAPWGDPSVQTAAQLAEALSDIAKPLKLTRIVPVAESMLAGTRIVCRLKTGGGTEFLWGSFVPDDPKTEAKKKKLWDLHERFRTLDNVPVDFRDLSKE